MISVRKNGDRRITQTIEYRFGYVTNSYLSQQKNWDRNESEILFPEPHNSKADIAWNRWSISFWRSVEGNIEQKLFYSYEIPEKYTNFKSRDEVFVANIWYGAGTFTISQMFFERSLIHVIPKELGVFFMVGRHYISRIFGLNFMQKLDKSLGGVI
jgi:hypothetical protein